MANTSIKKFTQESGDTSYEVTIDGDLFDEYASYKDSDGNKVLFKLSDVLRDLLEYFGHTVKIV